MRYEDIDADDLYYCKKMWRAGNDYEQGGDYGVIELDRPANRRGLKYLEHPGSGYDYVPDPEDGTPLVFAGHMVGMPKKAQETGAVVVDARATTRDWFV